ncbi:Calmodulin-binding protein 60 A [Abeliophyllum distichum]|uniref:Calmodulin-binding protein 60 A n=1 Tax=Abeliophyllum distichum TaxID=126358 RepID=A0ABD1RWM6_9LAMI
MPNLQIEDANNGQSEHANSSDDDQMVMVSRKMMKKELEDILIPTVQQVLTGPIMVNLIQEVVSPAVQQVTRPIVEDSIRKVVKEEMPLALEQFLACHNCENLCYRNSSETTASRPRGLELKFLDEVSDSVLTGKEIMGKGGTHIKVSLVDNVTGRTVDSGSEASAKVEIFLETGHDNNADSIGRENDKMKPHFPKPVHVSLKKGIGFLSNVKLGHGANWMKSCKCRLGARIVDKFNGSSVKEARTESFKVLDSRGELYKKHHPPSLDDDVWRLDHIGKDGAPCKRLHEANVTKVKDFLFLLSIDPQGLQKKLNAGPKKFKDTVKHARECKINDRNMYVYCSSSSESKNGVVFDVVGQLKGVLRNCRFVPIESAYDAEKDEARKLLASAFENRKDITLFEDETSLLHRFPYISNYSNATNSTGLDSPDNCNRSIIVNIDRHDPTQPGTSSQGCKNVEYSYGSPSEIPCDSPVQSWTSWLNGDNDLEFLGNFFSNGFNPYETNQIESHSDQQSIARSNDFVAVATFVRLFFSHKSEGCIFWR